MFLRPTLRRALPRARTLVATVSLTIGVLGIGSATALAANPIGSFTVSPATITAGQHPNLTASISFSYTSVTDTVKDVTVALPPGALASPAAVPATCTSAEITATTPSCPAGSLIGTGTANATGLPKATVNVYLMPPPTSSDVAGVGAIASIGPLSVALTGSVDLDTSGAQPVGELKFTNITNAVQIKGLALTINGTSTNGQPFIYVPTGGCSGPLAGTITADTYAGDSGSATSGGITETGCSSLPYAPTITGSATKDSADSGVAVTTTITQNAGEAASSIATLTIPSGTLTPNATAAGKLLNSSTPVGTATATSPLLSAPLSGQVFLTGASLLQPDLTVKFPAPFGITLTGTVDVATNSVKFTGIPDLPLTNLTVVLSGGANALFQTTCAQPSGTLAGSFTGQNGATYSSSQALTVAGCSTLPGGGKTPQPPTIAGGSLSGFSKGKPKLHFKLTAGANAPEISSFSIALPSGVKIVSKKLKSGLKLSGAKLKSAKVSHGKLVVTLKTAAASVGVTISGKVVKVSKSLVKRLKHHPKPVTLKVTVTDASGRSTTLPLVIAKVG